MRTGAFVNMQSLLIVPANDSENSTTVNYSALGPKSHLLHNKYKSRNGHCWCTQRNKMALTRSPPPLAFLSSKVALSSKLHHFAWHCQANWLSNRILSSKFAWHCQANGKITSKFAWHCQANLLDMIFLSSKRAKCKFAWHILGDPSDLRWLPKNIFWNRFAWQDRTLLDRIPDVKQFRCVYKVNGNSAEQAYFAKSISPTYK